MFICEICKKSLINESFVKDRYGNPLYYAQDKFFAIDGIKVFCCPEHSAEWHEKNIGLMKKIK